MKFGIDSIAQQHVLVGVGCGQGVVFDNTMAKPLDDKTYPSTAIG